MYELTGKETEVLVPNLRTKELEWKRVLGFCWEHGPDGEEDLPPTLVGVYPEGQPLRRRHVVADGKCGHSWSALK